MGVPKRNELGSIQERSCKERCLASPGGGLRKELPSDGGRGATRTWPCVARAEVGVRRSGGRGRRRPRRRGLDALQRHHLPHFAVLSARGFGGGTLGATTTGGGGVRARRPRGRVAERQDSHLQQVVYPRVLLAPLVCVTRPLLHSRLVLEENNIARFFVSNFSASGPYPAGSATWHPEIRKERLRAPNRSAHILIP